MKHSRVILYITASLLVSLCFSFSARSEGVALVVGVSDYGSDDSNQTASEFLSIPSLPNAVRDANTIASALETIGFSVTKLENPNKRELLAAIAQFSVDLKEAPESATGIFYFAGHGAQGKPPLERDVDNYLIPIGADLIIESDLESEAVGLSRISSLLVESSPRAAILILDACRDFVLPTSLRSSASTRGLAESRAYPGTLIAYSTAPGKVATDGVPGENGPYARALADELLSSEGSRIEDIFIRVRDKVLIATGDTQIPWENSSLRTIVTIGEAQSDEKIRTTDALKVAIYALNSSNVDLTEEQKDLLRSRIEDAFSATGAIDVVVPSGAGSSADLSLHFNEQSNAGSSEVDLIVAPLITSLDFSYEHVRNALGDGSSRLRATGVAKVNVRVVAVNTGQLQGVFQLEELVSADLAPFVGDGLDHQGFRFDSFEDAFEDASARVFIELIDAISFRLTDRLYDDIFPAEVIQVLDGAIYLSRGSDAGYRQGDRLRVFAKSGETLMHPVTGSVLGIAAKEIGLVEIVETLGEFSIAREVSSSGAIEVGSTVRRTAN